MIHYVCKYTPTELFQGFGEKCAVLEEMPENFEMSDQIAHANLCGFGKSVIQAVLEGKAEELVLVNCCDSMRRVYDIVESTGKCKFLYMLDIPHDDEECEKVKFAASICRLKEAYEEYSGKKFDKSLFLKAFEQKDTENKPYIGVLGVRVSGVLEQMIRENIQMNVENLTLYRRAQAGGHSRRYAENGRRSNVSCICGCTALSDAVFQNEQQHPQKPAVSGSVFKRNHLSYN